MDRFISYLKARKMISKGYLYNVVWVKHSSLKTPTLESVPIVCEFPENLLGVSHKSEIEFGIGLLIDT